MLVCKCYCMACVCACVCVCVCKCMRVCKAYKCILARACACVCTYLCVCLWTCATFVVLCTFVLSDLRIYHEINNFQAENILFSFDWIVNGKTYTKPKSSCFMKTSPEVEVALYTLCFQTRRNQDCLVSVNGGDIITIKNSDFNNKDNIGSAYAACEFQLLHIVHLQLESFQLFLSLLLLLLLLL